MVAVSFICFFYVKVFNLSTEIQEHALDFQTRSLAFLLIVRVLVYFCQFTVLALFFILPFSAHRICS